MASATTEAHALHIAAIVRQERLPSYTRRDYLSADWQSALWQARIREVSSGQGVRPACGDPYVHHLEDTARGSPSSVVPSPLAPAAPSEICSRWRDKIVEWKYQIVDRFDLDRGLVAISSFYLDRYLSMHYVDEELFQLAAMTSIYLAIKVHSTKKISIEAIASTGNGYITVAHIQAMELDLLQGLDWNLHPPTAVGFLENIFPVLAAELGPASSSGSDGTGAGSPCPSPLGGDSSGVLEFAKFLSELSVCAYPFVNARPSSVAIAALGYGFDYFALPPECKSTLRGILIRHGLDMKTDEVRECKKLLRRIYKLAMPNDCRGSWESI